MARTQGTNARSQRLTALLATALLATATAFAIGRVFVDHASTYRMAVAGLLSAAIAVALERRSLLLATVVSAAAMIVVVGFMVFPETTWHGLPTLETLRAMADAAGLVGEQARVQVAPTDPSPPLMLAALTATWAAIFSAHALAFRAGSPILALLPPIALVAFADTVLEEIVRPLYGVAFLIAATAMIFADGLRRVQGWGPVWTGPGHDARLTLTAGRGARRVAAAAIALAAVSPLLVPGFGSTAIIDLSSSGDDSVRLNPLVSVSAQLQRDEPSPVFDVSSELPSYWRVVALPDFDGTNWRPDEDPVVQDVVDDTPWAVNDPADPSVPREELRASFRTTGELALPWLPMPYPAVSTDLSSEGLQWDPEAGALSLDDPVDEGVTYQVVAQSVRVTADELRALDDADPGPLAPYLAYPDLPPVIAETAQRWMAGADDNVYDRTMAIQERFASTGGFTYDDQVEPRDGADALVEFLNRKTGFCQQFASAMAIMLRTQGIPSRVAVGFTAGDFDEDTGSYRVTTDQAHAWVEVYFPTYGWLTFEPTPNRVDTIAYPYLDPTSPRGCSGPQCVQTGGGGPGDRTGQNGGPTLDQNLTATKEGTFGDRGSGSVAVLDPPTPLPSESGTSPRTWLGLGVLVVLLGLAMIPPVRELRRRVRLRKAAREPRILILTTYDVFTERAGELGFPRGPDQTLLEYREGVRTDGGFAEDAPELRDLTTLTTLTSDAAYAPREPLTQDADDASRAASTTLKALRRNVGWARRISGAYRRR